MKHPFQFIVADSTGQYLFCSSKNTLFVFDLTSSKIVGQWTDELDNSDFVKKKYEEKFAPSTGDSDPKRLKSDSGKAKVPKIPTPGPGAPPIYNYIRALSVTQNGDYLFATTDSDKAAVVFEIDHSKENCLELVKRQPFAKRPSALFADDEHLVVADKFGDVYTIDIKGKEVAKEKEMVPILGHVSMLSDVLILEHKGKKSIITCDRDEHIRISRFPQSYVIENFLFGHREFVSSLHVPLSRKDLLISGGGDDYLCLWKWHEGELVTKIQLRELISSFLTDNHLPPERFLTETSPREISVSKIITFQNEGVINLLVSCEQTKAVLVFEISKDLEIKSTQTIEFSNNVLDMCYIDAEQALITAHDSDQNQLLSKHTFDNTSKQFKQSNNLDAISASSTVDVSSRNEFLPLYYINTLRKRSEH